MEATAATSSGVKPKPKVYLWWISIADCSSSHTSSLWKSEGYVGGRITFCVQFLIFFPSWGNTGDRILCQMDLLICFNTAVLLITKFISCPRRRFFAMGLKIIT